MNAITIELPPTIDLSKLLNSAMRRGPIESPDHKHAPRLVTRARERLHDITLSPLSLPRVDLREEGLRLEPLTALLRLPAKPDRPKDMPAFEVRLRPPKTRTLTAERSRGTQSVGRGTTLAEQLKPIDIEVPGAARFINARTLRAMFGAGRGDVLFRKVADRWQVCEDEYRVDLAGSDVFRLNEVVTIYS